MVNNLQLLQDQLESSEDDEQMKAKEESICHSGFTFFVGLSFSYFSLNGVLARSDNPALRSLAQLASIRLAFCLSAASPSVTHLCVTLLQTSYCIRALLLAMTVFPSVQEKACAEIDRIVGSERPPTLDDFDDMPYLRAVVLENLRWCPLSGPGES